VRVSSHGDQDRETELARFGRTGIFTVAVDAAVLEERADLGVHSLKDMTTTLVEGLSLAGVLPRGPVEDALLTRDGRGLTELPRGARVATGSARRAAELRRVRPDLEVVGLRGNVETRLARLEEGGADAILLARAGLERLGLAERIAEVLDPRVFVPAVGQGIVGLTCRAGDERTRRTLAALSDREAWAEALAERALLRGLRGGCHAPVGGHARAKESAIALHGLVLAPDGAECVEGYASGPLEQAEELGARLAVELEGRGAGRLLAAARAEEG
jgi:hydroxymethylbilane synthase